MSLNPFKKKVPMTEAEKIEQVMIFKYNLTKDEIVPNRYWLNHEKFIDFLPGDAESRDAAEKEIQAYYRKPQLVDADETQLRSRPMTNKKKKKSGIGDFLENAGKGAEKVFGPVGDQFIKNAPNVTNDMANMGMGTMRDGVRNSQNLGSSVNMGMRAPTVDDGLAGINPKIDMDTILGQVKKEPVKRATKKPVAKKR